MACPFYENPVDLGAQLVRRALRRERTFRDRCNPFELSEQSLYERYRFSGEGLQYNCQLLEPYISNVMHRNHALTVPQTVCIALRFFATGTFMYSVGDAENLGKNIVCRAIHKVAEALTELVDAFVVFPGHLPTQCIKEGFYDIAAMSGFPNVIGAIDCIHIAIRAPSENEFAYSAEEVRFNVAHSRARSNVERAIGLLKGRWKCLDVSGGRLL
ncbi:putative nuclease HARBI1 [Chaetodon trifascialis]|uniref:putative nuclease HARBI1 n=1 Tax=Chaetodon trifascialis TaxID=109706 RepID=UPI003993CA97